MGWKTGIFGILGGVAFALLAFAYADLALWGGLYVQIVLGAMTVVAAAAAVFTVVAFRTRSTDGRAVRRVQFNPPNAQATPPQHERPKAGSLAYEEAATLIEPLKLQPVANPEITLTQHATNVLCGACGSFFQVDLDGVRPMALECQSCNIPLLLDGRSQHAVPLELRCRACHVANHVPKADNLAAYQCAACGTVNQLRAVGEAKARLPMPTPPTRPGHRTA